MLLIFILALSPLCLASPVSRADGDDEDINYRLSKDIIPHTYTLNINLATASIALKTFRGEVVINLELKTATNNIVLHASRMELFDVHLVNAAGDQSFSPVSSDLSDVTDLLTINFEEELAIGFYVLTISYQATLSDDDMYGFYQSKYQDAEGNTKILASTQFENGYARRAFPCFDEPEMKATFDITITAPLTFASIISNMRETVSKASKVDDEDYITKTFQTTPIMSTYLVAFIVSEFASTSATDSEIPFTVWAKPGTQTNVVLDNGPQLLVHLGAFTNIRYEDHGIGKMDVAAIPDFAAGAMENWGLVTYREILLVDDGDETSHSITQRIATTIAHEFTHSWFGDLVTMDWWSDTWLNEGFATYFETFITHEVHEDWELNKQFLVSTQQVVLQADGLSSSQPLSSPESEVNSPAETDNKFTSISYDKGGSVIRMLGHITGDKFQPALQSYLDTNKNQNSDPSKLFTAFDEQNLGTLLPAGKHMGDVMHSWVYESGYPVITLAAAGDTITVKQERFLYNTEDNADTTKWYVYVTYITKAKAEETSEWLTPDADLQLATKVNVDDWIIANHLGNGFYRVNYDDALWQRISDAFTASHEDIDPLNRAQIIDDIFNLARIGKVDYTTVFELGQYLEKETDYYAWTAAFNSYSYLLKRAGTSDLGNAINAKLRNLTDTLYNEFKPDTPKTAHIDVLNQAQTLTWTCNLGHEACITYSKTQFENYKSHPTQKPNTDFRSFIYCTALRNSDSSENWNFLWDEFIRSQSSAEQNIILTALGCTKNETILNDYLTRSITPDSGIRKQDANTAFKSVYNGNPEGVKVAYQFLKDNYEEISNYYKGMSSLANILLDIADKFTTVEEVNDLKAFIGTDNIPDQFKIVGEQAAEAATININWLNKYESTLNKIFNIDDDNGNNSATSTAATGLVLFISFIFAFMNAL